MALLVMISHTAQNCYLKRWCAKGERWTGLFGNISNENDEDSCCGKVMNIRNFIMMFCVECIFWEQPALDVENHWMHQEWQKKYYRMLRLGERATRVPKPRQAQKLLWCWCCLKVVPSEFLSVFIFRHITHLLRRGNMETGRLHLSWFSKAYFCPKYGLLKRFMNMKTSKPNKKEFTWQVVVHGEVYSVWSLLEASCFYRGRIARLKQDPVCCVFDTNYQLPFLKLTVRTWKWMVGRWVFFGEQGLFSGAKVRMLFSGSVYSNDIQWFLNTVDIFIRNDIHTPSFAKNTFSLKLNSLWRVSDREVSDSLVVVHPDMPQKPCQNDV